MAADEPSDDRFRRLLAQQLEMNPRTWAALEEHGVDTRTPLVIEYSFTAPGRRESGALMAVLRARTNFTSQVVAEGPRLRRQWRVIGHTRPAIASVEMLNDWVTFMVTLGAKNGACRFDGWGVKLPDRTPTTEESISASLQQGFSSNGHVSGNGQPTPDDG